MNTHAVTPLRHRLIEDMNARKLCAGTQRGHIHSCKRFAVFLNRSPDTATTEDIRRFQLHLAEAGVSICNRNRIMTGVRFLFRVTLRRLDLAGEIYHIREPQKIPLLVPEVLMGFALPKPLYVLPFNYTPPASPQPMSVHVCPDKASEPGRSYFAG